MSTGQAWWGVDPDTIECPGCARTWPWQYRVCPICMPPVYLGPTKEWLGGEDYWALPEQEVIEGTNLRQMLTVMWEGDAERANAVDLHTIRLAIRQLRYLQAQCLIRYYGLSGRMPRSHLDIEMERGKDSSLQPVVQAALRNLRKILA